MVALPFYSKRWQWEPWVLMWKKLMSWKYLKIMIEKRQARSPLKILMKLVCVWLCIFREIYSIEVATVLKQYFVYSFICLVLLRNRSGRFHFIFFLIKVSTGGKQIFVFWILSLVCRDEYIKGNKSIQSPKLFLTYTKEQMLTENVDNSCVAYECCKILLPAVEKVLDIVFRGKEANFLHENTDKLQTVYRLHTYQRKIEADVKYCTSRIFNCW